MKKNKWKIIEGYKTEENANTSKKEAQKELMQNAVSVENQETNTGICSKEIKTCEKSEEKQQKSEQNKEESRQMIKNIKQYEEYDRKDNNSGVSRNKSNENETNVHKKLKGIIQTTYHISKSRKESSDKDGESTDERQAYQMEEKGTNRQSERKYDNYNQNNSKNESKITDTLRTRRISKSRDKLLTAHNSSDLEQRKNKTQNVIRDILPICDKYVKTGVQCGYCLRWFHFSGNTTEEQSFKRIPSRITIHMHGQDQHQKFESILQFQYQKKTEEIKKLNEKYENAKKNKWRWKRFIMN